MNDDGVQAVLGCSDEASRVRQEIQLSVGEGPVFDARELGRPVLVPDLAAATGRWPGYATEGARSGIGAVWALPVQLGAVRLGVLTGDCDAPRVLEQREVTSLLVLARLATDILLDVASGPSGSGGPSGGGDESRSGRLDDAMLLRNEIYQAQGMVTVQLGMGLVEALAAMRARAFASGVDLVTLSIGILDGTIRLDDEP